MMIGCIVLYTAAYASGIGNLGWHGAEMYPVRRKPSLALPSPHRPSVWSLTRNALRVDPPARDPRIRHVDPHRRLLGLQHRRL